MSEQFGSMDLPIVVCVFDNKGARLSAVHNLLNSRFGKENVRSEAAVPAETEIAAFVAGLGTRWLILLHVGNDRSVSLAQAAIPALGYGRHLVLYSGGNSGNFDAIKDEVDASIWRPDFVRCVAYVNCDWLAPLRAAIIDFETPFDTSDRGADGWRTEGGGPGAKAGTGVPGRMQEFEALRAHVSHDLFTNAFCVPLGFHCTEVDSPRRRDLLVWARSDGRWWKNLRGPASRWGETRRAVESVLQRAGTLNSGAQMTAAFREVVDSARLAMGTIDTLMEKFAGSVFEDAGLTDVEIERFWTSTDSIRRALQAVRVTERGLDPEFFSEIFPPDEPASWGEG